MSATPSPPPDLMPVSIQREGPRTVRIEWNDQTVTEWTIGELRNACPCATCREKKQAPKPDLGTLPVLSAAEAKPLGIESMRPVGSYAYNISFSDGHSSGIYPFPMLYTKENPKG